MLELFFVVLSVVFFYQAITSLKRGHTGSGQPGEREKNPVMFWGFVIPQLIGGCGLLVGLIWLLSER